MVGEDKKLVEEVLELFSGNSSFSRTAKRYGIKTFTVDIDKKFNPDLCKDILKLKKSDIPFNPTVIWASPPCTEYSHAKRRGLRNIKYANSLVRKTLEVVSWFPKSIWFIENPQTGLLKKQGFMDDIAFNDVSYCRYGYPYRKQTRIWTNFDLWFPQKPCKKDCEFVKDGKHLCSVGNARPRYTIQTYSTTDKYHIPEELCVEIIQSIISSRRAIQKTLTDMKKKIEEMIESVELAGFDNPVDEAYWNALVDVLALIKKKKM